MEENEINWIMTKQTEDKRPKKKNKKHIDADIPTGMP